MDTNFELQNLQSSSLLTNLIQYVITTCDKYSIDESHGLTHSTNVLKYSHNIYSVEVMKNQLLENYKKIIYIAAFLHDMCDKKYMDETEGINNIETFLTEQDVKNDDIQLIKKIIMTMSYSTVKKNGFPTFENKEQEMVYHIVRESDLLNAYDFDRCMIYHMNRKKCCIHEAYKTAMDLFQNRMFRHTDDGLFITDYSKHKSQILHNYALNVINKWKNIILTFQT
jgi:hypothetical protein